MKANVYLTTLLASTWYPEFEKWLSNECVSNEELANRCLASASDAVSVMYDIKEQRYSRKIVEPEDKKIHFIDENSGEAFCYSFHEFPISAFIGAVLAMITAKYYADEVYFCGMMEKVNEWKAFENMRHRFSSVFLIIGQEKKLTDLLKIIIPNYTTTDANKMLLEESKSAFAMVNEIEALRRSKHTNIISFNQITAIALAMQAKGEYRYSSRADFIRDAKEKYPEFSSFSEEKLLGAMNDLLQKNTNGDFTTIIKDQGSMITFIEGCYTKTKRNKESTACSTMKIKANEYFQKI